MLASSVRCSTVHRSNEEATPLFGRSGLGRSRLQGRSQSARPKRRSSQRSLGRVRREGFGDRLVGCSCSGWSAPDTGDLRSLGRPDWQLAELMVQRPGPVKAVTDPSEQIKLKVNELINRACQRQLRRVIRRVNVQRPLVNVAPAIVLSRTPSSSAIRRTPWVNPPTRRTNQRAQPQYLGRHSCDQQRARRRHAQETTLLSDHRQRRRRIVNSSTVVVRRP